MKPRTLKTYPILAVALTAAGCTRPAPPEPRPEIVPAAAAPAVAARAVAVRGLPAPAVAAAPEAAPADPGVVWAGHFQPPTDADGYPLVGNLVRKGGSDRPDGGADGGQRREVW